MWRSGISRRRQRAALIEMVQAAVDAGAPKDPWRVDPDVLNFYADEDEILRELQREWRTALAGAVYIAIENGDGDLAHDVCSAFAKVARRMSGIRQILEANAEHPSIAAAMRKERSLLTGFVDTPTLSPTAPTAPTGSPQAA